MRYLRGERYNLEKKESTGRSDRDFSGGKNYHPKKTAEKIAKECGVSEKTDRNAGKFAEAVDKLPPEEKQEILSGKKKKTLDNISYAGNM